MKTLFFLIIASTIISGTACGQNSARQGQAPVDKSKMEVFHPWSGRWTGEGTIQQGPGAPKKSSVEENLEMKLDGMILVVEGIGKSNAGTSEEKVAHHAFAVLSYDQIAKAYKFKTYLMDGRTADAWFEVVGENKFQWGFDVPSGKIKYTINIDPNARKWNEVGEFSADGNVWNKFFEMNLTKQG